MAEPHIRRATCDDAEIIAQLVVAAWRESYASLAPPEALNALDVEKQAARWREIFRDNDGDDACAVFLVSGGGEPPCGFGACGRQRSPRLAEAGFPGEFAALHLLRRAQRRGIGRALMGAMAEHLIVNGFSSASVWVFRDNPQARLFYEALGGEKTGIDGEWTIFGVTFPYMSYGWRDISALVGGA